MDCWLNIGVKGSACWPTEETKINFGGHDLILKPATKDTEQSIHINLHYILGYGRIDIVDAMTVINRFLSILSWCDDQGMETREVWPNTPKPMPMPREEPVFGSSPAFPFYRELETDPRVRLALALYREARTINSVPFSFLNYFKILNIFWQDNKIIEGIRTTLPQVKDDLARERIEGLKNRGENVPKYLYISGRCAVAHAYAAPIVDPDNIQDLQRLSYDRDIIKAIAEFLIETELKVSRSILG